MVPLKAAALLYQLVVDRYWRSEGRCVKGSPASVGMLHVNSKWQSDLTEKCCSSCTCLGVWSLVIALLPLPLWSLFHGGSSFSLSFCVQLPKTRLLIVWLYQACCLDFSPVWMCLKKVTEIKVLLLTGVV